MEEHAPYWLKDAAEKCTNSAILSWLPRVNAKTDSRVLQPSLTSLIPSTPSHTNLLPLTSPPLPTPHGLLIIIRVVRSEVGMETSAAVRRDVTSRVRKEEEVDTEDDGQCLQTVIYGCGGVKSVARRSRLRGEGVERSRSRREKGIEREGMVSHMKSDGKIRRERTPCLPLEQVAPSTTSTRTKLDSPEATADEDSDASCRRRESTSASAPQPARVCNLVGRARAHRLHGAKSERRWRRGSGSPA